MKLHGLSSRICSINNNNDENAAKQAIDSYFKQQSRAEAHLKQLNLSHICSDRVSCLLNENNKILINKMKYLNIEIIYAATEPEFCSLVFEDHNCTAKVISKETLKFAGVDNETKRFNYHEFSLSKVNNKWIIFSDKNIDTNSNSIRQCITNRSLYNDEIQVIDNLLQYHKSSIEITKDDSRKLNRGKMKLYQIDNWNKRPRQWGNFDDMGGDCTNYASQVVYAGGAPMITGGEYKWYYYGYGNRHPSWTGVEQFFSYLTKNKADGVHGYELLSVNELKTGDIIQMDLDGDGIFNHTSVVYNPTGYKGILPTITSHSLDRFNEPILSFNFTDIRLIHLR